MPAPCQPGVRAKTKYCKAGHEWSERSMRPRDSKTDLLQRNHLTPLPQSSCLKKKQQLSITYFVGHTLAKPSGRWKALYKLYAHMLTLINFLCANIFFFLLHCPSPHYISSLIWRTRNCWQLKYFLQLFFWDSEMQALNTALCSADCFLNSFVLSCVSSFSVTWI